MRKALLVHGYGIAEVDGQLVFDPLTSAVCDKVARIEHEYDVILLLGGWHHKSLGPDRLIGDVMKERLISLGVNPDKMMTFYDLVDVGRMPSRDTLEEIWVAADMLKAVDSSHGDFEVHVLCVWDFWFRCRILYSWWRKKLCLPRVKVITVIAPGTHKRIWGQVKALRRMTAELLGISEEMKVHRQTRTIDPHRRPYL